MEVWRSAAQEQEFFSCQLATTQGLRENGRQGERLRVMWSLARWMGNSTGQRNSTNLITSSSALHRIQVLVKRINGTWKPALKFSLFLSQFSFFFLKANPNFRFCPFCSFNSHKGFKHYYFKLGSFSYAFSLFYRQGSCANEMSGEKKHHYAITTAEFPTLNCARESVGCSQGNYN